MIYSLKMARTVSTSVGYLNVSFIQWLKRMNDHMILVHRLFMALF